MFEAGQESARDPKYTVVPQRERLDRRLPSVTDGAFNALQAQLARLMPATLSAPVARLAIRPGRKK